MVAQIPGSRQIRGLPVFRPAISSNFGRVVDDLIDGLSPETLWADDNTKVLQGLLVEVDEAYAHCPRAFLFSKLWDPERLAESLESDPNRYWFTRWREAAA